DRWWLRSAGLLPPQPAEHLHGQVDAADDRRGVQAGFRSPRFLTRLRVPLPTAALVVASTQAPARRPSSCVPVRRTYLPLRRRMPKTLVSRSAGITSPRMVPPAGQVGSGDGAGLSVGWGLSVGEGMFVGEGMSVGAAVSVAAGVGVGAGSLTGL